MDEFIEGEKCMVKRIRSITGKIIVWFTVVVMVILFCVRNIAATGQYSGELVVPKTSYNIKVGDYILDGTDVWTMEEEQRVLSRQGIICNWVHDGKSEGLADYDSGLYPLYEHYCENEEIFAPCYVIIYNENETLYRSYEDYTVQLDKIASSKDATDNLETYKAYYGKQAGTTHYVIKNGNLSITILITVTDSSGTNTTQESTGSPNANIDGSGNNKTDEITVKETTVNPIDTGNTSTADSDMNSSTSDRIIIQDITTSDHNSIKSSQGNTLDQFQTNQSHKQSTKSIITNPNLYIILILGIILIAICVFTYFIYKNKRNIRK